MARTARAKAESGFHHVTARGNGGLTLFEDSTDYRAFLAFLCDACSKHHVTLRAYCLMANHVHLLLDDQEDGMPRAMKSVLGSYALRYNARAGHIGHVFQQRYDNQPIETEEYLLQALRYIHNNPAKAGICPAGEYLWSSFHEYASGVEGYCDVGLILELLGGKSRFLEFGEIQDATYRPCRRPRVSDAAAREIAQRILGDISLVDLQTVGRSSRNELLAGLKDAGLSVRQIERLTGIGRSIIARA